MTNSSRAMYKKIADFAEKAAVGFFIAAFFQGVGKEVLGGVAGTIAFVVMLWASRRAEK